MHVTTLTVLLVGYLLGSIPFAYLLARRHRGIDLRMAGSGNVGAANLLRTTTKKIGVSAMALDMGKGIASVLVARQIEPGAAAPTIAGIAAVLGHIYPVWIGFKGGKGVATTCGVFAVLAPQATAIAGIFFLATVALLAAVGDWRLLRAGSITGTRRLARHLWRMCFGLFIASGSFFLGQAKFLPKAMRITPLLLALGIAPLIVLLYWMWRIRLRKRLQGMILRPAIGQIQ